MVLVSARFLLPMYIMELLLIFIESSCIGMDWHRKLQSSPSRYLKSEGCPKIVCEMSSPVLGTRVMDASPKRSPINYAATLQRTVTGASDCLRHTLKNLTSLFMLKLLLIF